MKRKSEESGSKPFNKQHKKDNGASNKASGNGKKSFKPHKKEGTKQLSDNPFETIRARVKHNVMGRDSRGTVRNVVKARSKAIAARQASLLQEFQHNNKAGKFVDSRIGADDEEEGGLKRFQEERQRRLNKAKRFALEEEEEANKNNDTLTHGGKPLTEAESNAGATAFSDDEENEDETNANFGGGVLDGRKRKESGVGEGEENDANKRERSTKEVMEEVIAKSKMYKLEKQEQAKQQEERLHHLDDDLSGIRGLLEFSKTDKKSGKEELGSDDPMALLAQIRGESATKEGEDDEEDEFLVEARKLALESRAQASDRLKTPEEVAKEEHARLQRLEAARVRRMTGEIVDDDEEEKLTAPQGGYAARRAKAKKELQQMKDQQQKNKERSKLPRTDEDLEGNFEIDVNDNNLDEEGEEEEEEDEDDEEEDDEEDDEDGEQNENKFSAKVGEKTKAEKSIEAKKKEEKKVVESKQQILQKEKSKLLKQHEAKAEAKSASAVLKSVQEDAKNATNEGKDAAARTVKAATKSNEAKTQHAKQIASANDSLPFVFDVPADYPAFAALLSPHTRNDQATILRRMIACHTLALGPDQRPLLERLYSLLMDHFRALCLALSPSSSAAASVPSLSTASTLSIATLFGDLDLISSVLWELSQMLPKFTGRFHRGYLIRVKRNLSKREREVSPNSSNMASLHHLLYFKLLSGLFPVSDFRHHVITPTMLIIGECLGRVPIKGGRDVAAGLFLADLIVSFIKDSKRLVPELLVFLEGLIAQGFAKTPDTESSRLNITIPCFFTGISGSEKKSQIPLGALLSKDNSDASFSSISFRSACLSATLLLVRQVHALYSALPSSPELFKGIEDALKHAGGDHPDIKTTIEDLAREHTKLRVPLAQVIRPPTIKQFNPAFEEDFRPGKDYDPSAQRAEIRKLSKKLKKEKRGAIKELRRDTSFLANEKHKLAEKVDKRSSDKMKRVRQDLEAQQKDTNYFAREGKKKRGKK